jgi:hypothetical protein
MNPIVATPEHLSTQGRMACRAQSPNVDRLCLGVCASLVC